MGSIRPSFVKRTATELVKKYYDQFTNDFYKNRDKLLQLTDMGIKTSDGKILKNHKRMVNIIAGYITRYWKHYKP